MAMILGQYEHDLEAGIPAQGSGLLMERFSPIAGKTTAYNRHHAGVLLKLTDMAVDIVLAVRR